MYTHLVMGAPSLGYATYPDSLSAAAAHVFGVNPFTSSYKNSVDKRLLYVSVN